MSRSRSSAAVALCAAMLGACSDVLGIQDPTGPLDGSIPDVNQPEMDAEASVETGIMRDAGRDAESGDATVDDAIDDDAIDGATDGAAETTLDSTLDGMDAPGDASRGDTGAACSMDAAWSPSALTGLVLWLDAGQGVGLVGTPITVWRDQSSQHNNATQNDSNYTPVLMTSTAGLPAAHFDGTQTFMSIADAPSLQWGTGDFVLEVVARYSSALGTPDQNLFQKAPSAAPYAGPFLAAASSKGSVANGVRAQLSVDTYVSSPTGNLQDAPHLFGMRRNGSTLELRIDGNLVATTAITGILDVSAAGRAVMFGQNGYAPGNGLQALDGDISEMIAVAGGTTAADIANLECYLTSKYGL